MERLRGQRHKGVDGGAPAEVPRRLAAAQADGAETPSLVPGLGLLNLLLLGEKLADLALPERAYPTRARAKDAVFPSERFLGAANRGPEMRSTGEAMAGADSVREAYCRALRAAGRSRVGGTIGPPLQSSKG